MNGDEEERPAKRPKLEILLRYTDYQRREQVGTPGNTTARCIRPHTRAHAARHPLPHPRVPRRSPAHRHIHSPLSPDGNYSCHGRRTTITPPCATRQRGRAALSNSGSRLMQLSRPVRRVSGASSRSSSASCARSSCNRRSLAVCIPLWRDGCGNHRSMGCVLPAALLRLAQQ